MACIKFWSTSATSQNNEFRTYVAIKPRSRYVVIPQYKSVSETNIYRVYRELKSCYYRHLKHEYSSSLCSGCYSAAANRRQRHKGEQVRSQGARPARHPRNTRASKQHIWMRPAMRLFHMAADVLACRDIQAVRATSASMRG